MGDVDLEAALRANHQNLNQREITRVAAGVAGAIICVKGLAHVLGDTAGNRPPDNGRKQAVRVVAVRVLRGVAALGDGKTGQPPARVIQQGLRAAGRDNAREQPVRAEIFARAAFILEEHVWVTPG